jgi:uncharacterized protein YecE (DUF72 family)
MDFGKVHSIRTLEQINFEFPPVEARVVELLKKKGTDHFHRPQIFVGCPIWGKKEWVGKVYPPGTSNRDFLKFYSQQFNSVELNTSFYRIPDLATVDSWKQSVSKNFQFCPKFFQGISHQNLLETQKLTQLFCDSVTELKENLGLSFLQLPQHFSIQHGGGLKKWVEFLPRGFPLAIEFRHSSWFENQKLHPRVAEWLEGQGISMVITDVAGRREVFHNSLTTPQVLVRFVGNGLHESDFSRLDRWVIRIGEWLNLGLKTLYFFVHQPDDTVAPDAVHYFIEKLNSRLGLSVQNWSTVESQQEFLF